MGLNLQVSDLKVIQHDEFYHGSPCVVEAVNGDWLLSYHKGVSHTDLPSVILRRSTDQGETWSPEVEIYNSNSFDPSMVVTPSGAVVMTFPKEFGDDPTLQPAFGRSEDNGLTWSAPQRLTPTATGSSIPTQFLTISGSIYCTNYAADSTRCLLWRSDDDGLSWTNISTIDPTGPQINETAILQIGPTSLLAIARALDIQHTYSYVSNDLGLTWSSAKEVIDSSVGVLNLPQLIRFGGAILLLARDFNTGQLVAFSSSDNGASFGGRTVLDTYTGGFNQGGYCWPLDMGDGRLFIVHYSNTATPAKPDIKSLVLSEAEDGMALGTPTNLTVGGQNSAGTSFSTASITPTVGNLILMAVSNQQTGATTGKCQVPQISGDGLTFNLLYSRETQVNPNIRFTIFWCVVPASGSSAGVLTISFTGSQARCGWTLCTVSGIDSTTPISWCVQAGGAGTGSNVTSYPDTLNALQDTSSLVIGLLFSAGTPAQLSPGAGWTQLSEDSTWGLTIGSIYKVNDPAVTWTQSVGSSYTALAVEITAANSGLVNNPLAAHLLGACGAGS